MINADHNSQDQNAGKRRDDEDNVQTLKTHQLERIVGQNRTKPGHEPNACGTLIPESVFQHID
jgi:hypothetical protein